MHSNSYDLQDALTENRLLGLWRIMTGFRKLYFGAAASMGLAATAKTATYFLLRFFVDDILGEGRTEFPLLLIGLGFVGLALLEGGFTFNSGRLAARTSEGITLRLRNYLYDHLQRLSFTYHGNTGTGELVQRASSDVDTIRRFYSEQAIGVGRILLLFFINLAALLHLNWRLALLSVIAVPIILALSIFFFRKIATAYEAYQEQDAVLSTTLQENLSGVRVVKAFARQDYERDKFEVVNWGKFRRGRKLLLMHSLYWPTSDVICGFQMLGGLLVGALMTLNGIMSLGTYLAYAGMIVWIIWPLRNLGRLIVQTSMAMISYGRVAEVIREEREPLTAGSHSPGDDLRGEVIFRDVSFCYGGGNPVLEEISFTAAPGQTVALLGPPGSGKTSLAHLLPRFYEFTSGSITLDGVDLNCYARRYLRNHIGIVAQESFLFSRTIRENVVYGVGRDVPDAAVEKAARAAAIHDSILELPDSYNTLVGEKGVTLSGGQKQRIAIARTLLKDPRILIMDDATAAVDAETEAAILASLEQLGAGRTTFIIAHRIHTVMNADLILVLDRGRVVQRGTHSELTEQRGYYRRIFELQARIEDELQQELRLA
jgi:ATP-binding cassette subfamily B protein